MFININFDLNIILYIYCFFKFCLPRLWLWLCLAMLWPGDQYLQEASVSDMSQLNACSFDFFLCNSFPTRLSFSHAISKFKQLGVSSTQKLLIAHRRTKVSQIPAW